MFLPRFTIRTALLGVTLCAFAFVVAGMALRGETWAWGITIGLVSLAATLVVHAAWFSLVSMFAQLPAAQPAAPSGITVADASQAPTDNPSGIIRERTEAKS